MVLKRRKVPTRRLFSPTPLKRIKLANVATTPTTGQAVSLTPEESVDLDSSHEVPVGVESHIASTQRSANETTSSKLNRLLLENRI